MPGPDVESEMMDDLDETLRKLLLREQPAKNCEVDIQFHRPRREWSANLSRPTSWPMSCSKRQ
jgi:hypothetical protein